MTVFRPLPAPPPAGERPAPGAAPAPAPRARVQPPLREAFKGLDMRELEGETVFDQLFGPDSPAKR